MNKIQSIQALRGIAVLGVLGLHAFAIERKYSTGDYLLPKFLEVGQSGVDLFFVISGYIIVIITKGGFSSHKGTVQFLWNRFARIYPTYWFYFLLTATVFWVKPIWFNSSQGHQADLLASFLLLPSNQIPLVMVSWSLTYELWFYLLFSPLLIFHEKFVTLSLLVWGGIIVAANMFVTTSSLSTTMRFMLHPYSLEFIMGALVALFSASPLASRVGPKQLAMMVAFPALVGLPFCYKLGLLLQEGLMRTITLGAVYSFVLFGFVRLESLNKFKPPKSLQLIGDISYTVYLSHILVLSAIGRTWLYLIPNPDSIFDNTIACLLMLALSLAYGWFGYRFIEKPLLNLTRFLWDYRSKSLLNEK